MTNYRNQCQTIMERGTGRNVYYEPCGKDTTWVIIATDVEQGLCNRHANTKTGRMGQRIGTVVRK